MPPNSGTQIYGDFNVNPASNTLRGGFGKLKLASNMELSAAYDANPLNAAKVATSQNHLSVSSAKDLALAAVAGNVGVTASGNFTTNSVNNTSVSSGIHSHTATGAVSLKSVQGSVSITAPFVDQMVSVNAPQVSLVAGADGLALSASGTGVSISAFAGVAQLLALGDAAKITSSTKAADVKGYTDCTVTADTGDVLVTASAAGKAITLSSDVVNIGKTASSVTNIVGDLQVQGTTTTVNSTQLTVADNLITVNSAPAATGRNGGVLFERHFTDIAGTSTVAHTTALSGSFAVAGKTIAVADAGPAAIGWVVKVTEGAKVYTSRVKAVATNSLLMLDAAVEAFTTASVVELYKTTASALIFDEATQVFKLGYTLSGPNAVAPVISEYADLQVKDLIVQGNVLAAQGFATPGFATMDFSIADNHQVPKTLGLRNRGAYDLLVESVLDGGFCGTWRIVKSKSNTDSFLAVGTVLASEDSDEQLEISWPSGGSPSLHFSTPKTGGTGLTDIAYKVKYLSVF